MKNVTITLPEATVQRARVAAAKEGKSLSKFVSELVARKVDYDPEEMLKRIEPYLSGPGFPGIAKAWPGREKLYAEREDELLRRYERSRLHGGSEGTGEAPDRREFAEKDDRQRYTGPEHPKSE